jgi:uncharacterized protein with GYD domain
LKSLVFFPQADVNGGRIEVRDKPDLLHLGEGIQSLSGLKGVSSECLGVTRGHDYEGPVACHVSYTPEALARLIANPQDRLEAVRAPIEKLGGKIKDSYFAFGEHDAVLITVMPDNVSAAAIAMAFAAGGALRNCQTTALMSAAEALDAMRKAGTCGYKPVTATASAAAARP